jgi:hypothetical protein
MINKKRGSFSEFSEREKNISLEDSLEEGLAEEPLRHQSHYEITASQTKNEKLQVRNHVPVSTNNRIVKITEVEWEGKIVKIVDDYAARPISRGRIPPEPTSLSMKDPFASLAHRRLLDNKNES